MFGDTTFQIAYYPFHISHIKLSEGITPHSRSAIIRIIAQESSKSFFSEKFQTIKTYNPCLSLVNYKGKIRETVSDLRVE